jgi:hypothetical protein
VLKNGDAKDSIESHIEREVGCVCDQEPASVSDTLATRAKARLGDHDGRQVETDDVGASARQPPGPPSDSAPDLQDCSLRSSGQPAPERTPLQ